MGPRSRAAATRNHLDPDQRQPTIRRRGRSRNTSACQRSSGNATHASFSHPWHYRTEAVCVATTSRIRRSAYGRRSLAA
jgi:hypothetical protein